MSALAQRLDEDSCPAHEAPALALARDLGRRLYIAHPDAGALVVDPAGSGLVHARALDADLRWRCAHESAALVLERVTARAEREGDLTTGLAGAALRLALPIDDATRARYEREHRRLLSRLN